MMDTPLARPTATPRCARCVPRSCRPWRSLTNTFEARRPPRRCRASALGGAALREALPPPLLTEVPPLDLTRLVTETPDASDPLGEIDAVLLELTGAPPPRVHPVLERRTVEPLLTAARHLMNAVGRGYVEVAAAALAVLAIQPDAPVAATVRVADKALTALARDVLKAGKTLERAVDYRLDALDLDALAAASADLAQAQVSQQALMDWSFESLAGALDG